MISGEKLKLLVREKVNRFLHFAHNKETGQFFGKTCKGWGVLLVIQSPSVIVKVYMYNSPGQTFAFFLAFYSFLVALFAVHLAVFLSVTPQPGKDVEPTNFGRYAYPNYPNAKIGHIF